MNIKAKAGVAYLQQKLKKFFNKENEREVQKGLSEGITEIRKEIDSALDQFEDTTRSISTDLVTAGFQLGPNMSIALSEAYKANPRVIEQLVAEADTGYKEIKKQITTLTSTNKDPHISEIFGIYESMMGHAKKIAQTIECNEPECKAIVQPIAKWVKSSVESIKTSLNRKTKEETDEQQDPIS